MAGLTSSFLDGLFGFAKLLILTRFMMSLALSFLLKFIKRILRISRQVQFANFVVLLVT